MLPISDMNPTRRFPLLNYLFIGINIAVFAWELGLSEGQLQAAFINLAVVPADILRNPFSVEAFLDILRSMFFHGGIAHIAGNMLYLWLFGDNVEDRFGKILYFFVYMVSGFGAAIAQVLISPNSNIPLVGASGAIAGVLGAYLVFYPGVRVRGVVFLGYFMRSVQWPAWIVLGMWFLLQALNGVASLGAVNAESGGVAFFAHIGGFIVGAVLAGLFSIVVPQPPREQRYEALYERAQRYRF